MKFRGILNWRRTFSPTAVAPALGPASFPIAQGLLYATYAVLPTEDDDQRSVLSIDGAPTNDEGGEASA